MLNFRRFPLLPILVLALIAGQLAQPGPARAAITFDHTKTYTAAEAITAGKFVMVGPDNKIRAARDAGAEWRFALNQTFLTQCSGIYLVGPGKAIAVQRWNDQAKGSRLILVTLGSTGQPSAMTIDYPQGWIIKMATIPSLGTFVAECQKVDGRTYLLAGKIAGTQIQWGTLTALPSSITYLDAMWATDSGSVVIGCSAGLIPVAVQGLTLTLGATTTAPANVVPLSGNRLLLLSAKSSTMLGLIGIRAAVATVNGTTLSIGNWLDVDSSLLSGSYYGLRLDGDKVFIYNYNRSYIIQASGNTISVLGTVRQISYLQSCYPTIKNQLLSFSNDWKIVSRLTVTGAAIASGAPMTLFSRTNEYSWVYCGTTGMLDANRLLAVVSSDTFYGLTVLNLGNPPSSTMENWIGVAEQNASAGGTCQVTIGGGVTSRFSNLKPGAWYTLTEQGIMEFPSLDGTAGLEKKLPVGRAISTYELLINYSH